MVLKYLKPPGVEVSYRERPLLSTAEGGYIAIDETLLSLWELADGFTLDEIIAAFRVKGSTFVTTYAALACLAEGGLLMREGEEPHEPAHSEQVSGPLVTAIIVVTTEKELEWLDACLSSLFIQTYSPLEVIVIDNATTFNLSTWLEEKFPRVQIVRLDSTEPLARALNNGVSMARGSYFLLLNPDLKLTPDVVAHMVKEAKKDPTCAAVAAKLRFWWAPSFLNGLGNSVRDFAWGTDNAIGHLDLGQFDHWEKVPSACFAATLISRGAWEDVGPIDDGFPAYYEDSEWSYRARMRGYAIRVATKAVIYHVFGGWWRVPEAESGLSPGKLRNVVYGRLRFAIKIVGKLHVSRFLRNYALEDWKNFILALAKLNRKTACAYLTGWLTFLKDLPRILRLRKTLQAQRVCSDEELFEDQLRIPPPFIWRDLPELTWNHILHHYSPLILSQRTRQMPEFNAMDRRPHVLIVSNDVVDVKMAGPGMRYMEMARALCADLDVTLAIPSETSLDVPEIQMVRYWEERPESLRVLVENSDVALVSGYMILKFPFLASTRTRLVVDLYDPFLLENLHYYLNDPMEDQEKINRQAVEVTNHLSCIGDFFICGSERQRDFWMGVLAANGRVNPRTFRHDGTLRSLIDVVGIGFPKRAPRRGPLLRGNHPAIPVTARIVLWGGGVWNWLDPLTLVKAWPQVISHHPEARLVILGTRHPNPLVPQHEMAERTEALATEIGEKDRTIHIIEWLPYEEREALLCEADIGVTLHPIHVETRYSIRTRVLDYMWARLPILITDGDITSEWVRRFDLGIVVPPLNVDAVASALIEMLEKPKEAWDPAFKPLNDTFEWSRVVEPLRRYCLEGDHAPDWKQHRVSTTVSLNDDIHRNYLVRGFSILRSQGIRELLSRSWRHIQWRLGRF